MMLESFLRAYTDMMARSAAGWSDVLGIESHYQPPSGPVPGFSQDFRNWLEKNGYDRDEFAARSRPSFGGRSKPTDQLKNEPVIFIHGNGGSAADWREARETFLANGYQSCELYALTYDDGGPDKEAAMKRYHSKRFLEQIRAFIEAVKAYTGAEKVDVISHSLGVTLARGAIKGGSQSDLLEGGSYDLGRALTNEVDTFVGVAGANRGLASCALAGTMLPICGLTNGLSPMSAYLSRINSDPRREASNKVYSVWSSDDRIVGPESGETTRIPGEDASVSIPDHDHYDLIKETGHRMVKLVRDHDPGD